MAFALLDTKIYKEYMNKNCKQCKKPLELTSKEFCSDECRNKWVSELMIKKSKEAKRFFGNKYYAKKES